MTLINIKYSFSQILALLAYVLRLNYADYDYKREWLVFE